MVSITGFEGQTIRDSSNPDGQPSRMLDTSRAEKEFGFKAMTSLEEKLKKTIDWYRDKK
jgi:GDP-L-fucose synthase